MIRVTVDFEDNDLPPEFWDHMVKAFINGFQSNPVAQKLVTPVKGNWQQIDGAPDDEGLTFERGMSRSEIKRAMRKAFRDR
jgi:hypothetical protein